MTRSSGKSIVVRQSDSGLAPWSLLYKYSPGAVYTGVVKLSISVSIIIHRIIICNYTNLQYIKALRTLYVQHT